MMATSAAGRCNGALDKVGIKTAAWFDVTGGVGDVHFVAARFTMPCNGVISCIVLTPAPKKPFALVRTAFSPSQPPI